MLACTWILAVITKRTINFPETPCNLALFALKYSRYANRLGRRGVCRKLLSERTIHGWRWFQRARTEGSFRAGILNHVWNAECFETKPAIRTNIK